MESINSCNKAISLNPNLELAYRWCGWSFGSLKIYDLALANYNAAIHIDPNDWTAVGSRGYVYGLMNQPQKAWLDFDQEIKLLTKDSPNNSALALAYANRAVASSRLGNYSMAIADATKAMSIDRTCVLAYRIRGWCKYKVKDFDSAYADLTAAIKLNATSSEEKSEVTADPYFERAVVCHELRRAADELADLDKAISLNSGCTFYYDQRATIERQQRNYIRMYFDIATAGSLCLEKCLSEITGKWLYHSLEVRSAHVGVI